MDGLYLTFALLAVSTLCAVIAPWLWTRTRAPAPSIASHDRHFKGQLDQIEEDLAGGRINSEEAIGARAEIARMALAAEARVHSSSSGGQGGWIGIAAAFGGALILVPIVYTELGSPDLPDMPLVVRTDVAQAGRPTALSEHQGGPLAESIASLEARLLEQPDDLDGLLLLSRTYSAIGDDANSARILKRLIDIGEADATLMGDYAEAVVRAANGLVDPSAVAAFNEVLRADPKDPRARYYLALGDAQAGLSEKAVGQWAEILREAPPDATYAPAIRKIVDAIIEDAGLDAASFDLPDVASPRGPTQSDIAAAARMSEDDQRAMIRGMVDNLEARLEENPKDVDGWLRLIRSRQVLGEPEKVASALERALAANPESAELARLWDEFLSSQ